MGKIFKGLAFLVWILAGIGGFFLCMGIIFAKLGFVGAVVAFFVFPLTISLAPWYAGLIDGNWQPLAVIYGSAIAAAVLFFAGSLIDGD